MWLASPAVQGQDITTTRTDYVNKYPSIIQTTSYNFTGTQTTAERCVGVVNHCIIKIPLSMLQTWKCYKGRKNCHLSFFQDSHPKLFDCIRVDGAADEGPWYEEVQFWWAVLFTGGQCIKSKPTCVISIDKNSITSICVL